MAVINCVSAEYDSASQDLSNVASELESAQIDDFSETVQSALPGSRSIKVASSTDLSLCWLLTRRLSMSSRAPQRLRESIFNSLSNKTLRQ